jgi:hypothetical protein
MFPEAEMLGVDLVLPDITYLREQKEKIQAILREEDRMGAWLAGTYLRFATRVIEHKFNLLETLQRINREKKTVFGYGASTKGNVVLQFCGITTAEVPAVAEVKVTANWPEALGRKTAAVPVGDPDTASDSPCAGGGGGEAGDPRGLQERHLVRHGWHVDRRVALCGRI